MVKHYRKLTHTLVVVKKDENTMLMCGYCNLQAQKITGTKHKLGAKWSNSDKRHVLYVL